VIADTLAPRGWALSSGERAGVGGIGWREHGPTISHLTPDTDSRTAVKDRSAG
jgi:hypothetical protein